MISNLYIAGGCFLGLEELVRSQPGVVDTEVGYCGGQNDAPTYENHPGHAETVRVSYDTNVTSLRKLLDYFFRVHDPSTINRQGNDMGSSYRSAIFYQTVDEKRRVIEIVDAVNKSGLYPTPVVTSLEPFAKFWPAEEYHQDYLQKHPGGYTCHFVRREEPIVS